MVNGIGSYANYMSYLQTRTPRSSPDPAEMFNKTDSDGSGGMGGAHGPMGGSGREEDSSGSGYLDPLDTNGDGIVDAQEAAAGMLNMQTQNYMGLINSMFGIQEDNQRLVNLAA